MEKLILSPIPKDELISEIIIGLKDVLKQGHQKEVNEQTYMSPKEVGKFFGVSLVTVHKWSKDGILHKRKIGGRIRYRKDEVLSALKEIENKSR